MVEYWSVGESIENIWQLNWWEYQQRRQTKQVFKLLNQGVTSVDVDMVFFHNGFVACHPKRMTYALIDGGPGFEAKYNRCENEEYWLWSPRSNALIRDDDTDRLAAEMRRTCEI